MPESLGVSQFCTDGVTVRWTSRSTGSFALDQPDLAKRYRFVANDRDVVFPRQEHGTVVLDAVHGVADTPPSAGSSPASYVEAGPSRGSNVVARSLVSADAVVSVSGGPAIAVITADCAPIAIWTVDGVIGVAHAGWRGLVAGVVEATVAAVRCRSSEPNSVRAVLGPCIGPCCYEFGDAELATVEAVYGPTVRARTRDGQPALDMRAGVRLALERTGAAFEGYLGEPTAPTEAACTSCGSDWFSWRRNRDVGRQALIVQSSLLEPPPSRLQSTNRAAVPEITTP